MKPKIPEDLKSRYQMACDVDYGPLDLDSGHWRCEKELIERIASLEAGLKDHVKVHSSILRGDIALTRAEAIHIAGLPADVDERLRQTADSLDAGIHP